MAFLTTATSWLMGVVTNRKTIERELDEQRKTIAFLRETLVSFLAAVEATSPNEYLKIHAALARSALAEHK